MLLCLQVGRFAMDAVKAASEIPVRVGDMQDEEEPETVTIRVGFHSGPVSDSALQPLLLRTPKCNIKGFGHLFIVASVHITILALHAGAPQVCVAFGKGF